MASCGTPRHCLFREHQPPSKECPTGQDTCICAPHLSLSPALSPAAQGLPSCQGHRQARHKTGHPGSHPCGEGRPCLAPGPWGRRGGLPVGAQATVRQCPGAGFFIGKGAVGEPVFGPQVAFLQEGWRSQSRPPTHLAFILPSQSQPGSLQCRDSICILIKYKFAIRPPGWACVGRVTQKGDFLCQPGRRGNEVSPRNCCQEQHCLSVPSRPRAAFRALDWGWPTGLLPL